MKLKINKSLIVLCIMPVLLVGLNVITNEYMDYSYVCLEHRGIEKIENKLNNKRRENIIKEFNNKQLKGTQVVKLLEHTDIVVKIDGIEDMCALKLNGIYKVHLSSK